MKLLVLLSFLIAFQANVVLGQKARALDTSGFVPVLTGKLLKPSGKPVQYTEIELVPVGAEKIGPDQNLIAVSGSTGSFVFNNVPDGRYTLSINFDDKPSDLSPYSLYFYPNSTDRSKAEIFEVKNKQPLKPVTFRLPPALVSRKISGRVTVKDGTPVPLALIVFRDVEFDRFLTVEKKTTSRDGSFSLNGFETRAYQVGALFYDIVREGDSFRYGELLAATESEIFVLNAQTPPLSLRFGKDEDNQEELKNKYIGSNVLSAGWPGRLFGLD